MRNACILALEGNENFPQASELFRVLAIAHAKVSASVLTITEVINKSYEIGDTKRIPARLDFIHFFVNTPWACPGDET